MGKIFDTLLGKSSTPAEEGDYMELNLEDYEGTEDAPALLVKIATITDIKDSPKIKDEVYNGNIVIVDISRLKMDKIMYVVVTPQAVKISRDKIGGAV
jgi:SepF-like predicted cell division protein (DUF552 family)